MSCTWERRSRRSETPSSLRRLSYARRSAFSSPISAHSASVACRCRKHCCCRDLSCVDVLLYGCAVCRPGVKIPTCSFHSRTPLADHQHSNTPVLPQRWPERSGHIDHTSRCAHTKSTQNIPVKTTKKTPTAANTATEATSGINGKPPPPPNLLQARPTRTYCNLARRRAAVSENPFIAKAGLLASFRTSYGRTLEGRDTTLPHARYIQRR